MVLKAPPAPKLRDLPYRMRGRAPIKGLIESVIGLATFTAVLPLLKT